MRISSLSLKRSSRQTWAALAALLAGSLYIIKNVWLLIHGQMIMSSTYKSFIHQYFFMATMGCLAVLFYLYRSVSFTTKRTLFFWTIAGTSWWSAGRTLEAFGAPGPWGFYTSPGFVIACTGLFMWGRALLKKEASGTIGSALLFISVTRFISGFGAMVLYNVLGRTTDANLAASIAGYLLGASEGMAWILLGKTLLKLSYRYSFTINR